DHGLVRRARGRDPMAPKTSRPPRLAAQGLRRGRLGRNREGHARARLELRRGFEGRGRHEPHHHGQRPTRGDPGHRGRRSLLRARALEDDDSGQGWNPSPARTPEASARNSRRDIGVKRIVLASKNPGKVRELKRLLAGAAEHLESLADHPDVRLPEEGESSYRENAHEKARAVFEALGIPALGDVSGLEVDVLGGAPGVRSARFAGPNAEDVANNDLLLAKLRGVPADHRRARYRCALAFVWAGGESMEAEGVCEGRILEAPSGEKGFGYDPLFQPEGETQS